MYEIYLRGNLHDVCERHIHFHHEAHIYRYVVDTQVGSAGFRQLVGFRGAADTEDEPLWKIRIQLTKPGTWVPLIWGVACGAAASGNYRWPFLSGTLSEGAEDFAKAATCMVLSGPFLTGFCQTINDWRRRGVRFRT